MEESLLTCFLAVKSVRHQPARDALKKAFYPFITRLKAVESSQLPAGLRDLCIPGDFFFYLLYLNDFEFLKAAMPTSLRHSDKYEIFSSYTDIYRLLKLSGDADNLTRIFFFF